MRRWLAVTAWIGFVGCADTSPDTAGYQAVRDSAGVRIVDAGAPTASGWQVSSAPRHMLGWGPDDPDFTWIPAGRILPDGGAVLGEGREGRLYWLNAEGAVRATRGQRGEGPGEFQSIAGLVLDGDGVVAFDARLARLTRLSEGDEAFSTRRLFAPLAMASSIDREGRVLRDFALPCTPSDRWRVIDPDAGSVAWVEGLDLRVLLDIRGGRVLGVRYDPLDVPAVVMLDLTIP
ncbi:hypothetical protein [Gaopeijia maritima]|uniref:Phytase-like domain-containing protein n=1 Tax=Gaopeijia maritima TaxID=3119007 RepID=A0ABU9E680_9BACT